MYTYSYSKNKLLMDYLLLKVIDVYKSMYKTDKKWNRSYKVGREITKRGYREKSES